MNIIKAKKEQIDYERNRIRNNIGRILNSQFSEIDGKISGILNKELKNNNGNLTNLNIFTLDGMKNQILDEGEKIRALRVYY
jgi:hypothetical protein